MAQIPHELRVILAQLPRQQQEAFLAILHNARDAESLHDELENDPDLLNALLATGPSDSHVDDSCDLDEILSEISKPLTSQQEIPRRIELHGRALSVVQKEKDAFLWAGLHNGMGTCLTNCLQGVRAENLERAIEHYQEALTVYTYEEAPDAWAGVQNNLATAYQNRICKTKAENLEQAIVHYQQALTVCTHRAAPDTWAIIQHNLASAYQDRICGTKAENLEQALESYQRAMTVRTRDAWPKRWAMTQNGLANVYLHRICGERSDNLEQAIEHCRQALTVRTRDTDPDNWAMTQHNLGLAYAARIHGERADNLEQAIEHYQQALTVRTRDANPIGWANTKNSLACVYLYRIQGEWSENLEQAMVNFRQVLTVRTREADPEKWANTQHDLANVYLNRIFATKADNMEQAIEHCQQALTVRTCDADPGNWAMTQNTLGFAYAARIHGERADNLEQAIAHYQQALTIRTRDADPGNWAMTQYNLGLAYAARIHGERADNLEQAIAHYQHALTVRTCDANPAVFLDTKRNLGHLYFGEGAWTAAIAAYQEAIQAGKMLLRAAYTEPGRQAEVAMIGDIFARVAYALIKVGRTGEALSQLEQGKTRLLSQALSLNDIDATHLPRPQQDILQRLRQTLRALEIEMRLPSDTPARRNERELAQALDQVRIELNDTIALIRTTHSDFMPEGLSLPEILFLIPPHAALVASIFTSQGSAVFVVPAGQHSVSMEHVLLLDQFKDTDLDALLKGPASDSSEEPRIGGWLGAYFNTEHNAGVWRETISATGQALWTKLVGPIAERLATLKVTQVLLMPQGGLGLLPLHAAWHEVEGRRRYFLDDYTITYIPSAYGHKVSLDRVRGSQRHSRSFQAILDPTENLPFASAEGEQVARLFDDDKITVLSGAAATVEAVMNQRLAGYVHFACHGSYRWDDPMQSGLELANHEPLTLAKIIGHFNLENTRLVTLSACETGITDIRQAPDEYLGLPAGFLQAGAPAVVSTLWAVDDLSTMLLMERFYQLHLKEGQDLPVALRHAQIWLREVTAGELAQRFAAEQDALLSSTRMSIKTISESFRRFTKLNPREQPFAHPYYWAAFTLCGA